MGGTGEGAKGVPGSELHTHPPGTLLSISSLCAAIAISGPYSLGLIPIHTGVVVTIHTLWVNT